MSDDLLVEAATRMFADTCTPDALTAAEADGWAPGVWEAAAGMGLPWISIPEGRGGSGGTLLDALRVLQVAGAHAAPIPLAETGVLGGWLLAEAGLPLGDEPLAVAVDAALRLDGDRLTGTASGVGWVRRARAVVALVDGAVVAVEPGAAATIEHGTNLAGEPRAVLRFEGAPVVAQAAAPAGVDAAALRSRAALARVMQIAGALEAVSELTNRYTSERRQFGQPVASFQAVQALLVTAAEEAVTVSMAAQLAASAAAHGDATFEIAAAKTLAGIGIRNATRAVHQAHGAIGVTREYPLHHFTRRLWSWRAEFGDDEWAFVVADHAIAAGADGLYALIQRGSAART